MGKSNEIFKPWSPITDVVNWYRNALNRDPDLVGLQFWNDMYKRVGAEATWEAFCYAAKTLGHPISISREDASKGSEHGNNYMVVDEWFKNFNLAGDWQPYALMISNGMPIQNVFETFCSDYGVTGDWLEASKLK